MTETTNLLGLPLKDYDMGKRAKECAAVFDANIRLYSTKLKASYSEHWANLLSDIDGTFRINLYPNGERWYLEHYNIEAKVTVMSPEDGIELTIQSWENLTDYSKKARFCRWLWYKVQTAIYHLTIAKKSSSI